MIRATVERWQSHSVAILPGDKFCWIFSFMQVDSPRVFLEMSRAEVGALRKKTLEFTALLWQNVLPCVRAQT